MKRELPTEIHQRAWENFEKLLCYRSNISFLSRLMYDGVWYSVGASKIHMARLYIKGEKPFNEGYVEATFFYYEWTMILLIFGRIFLLVISYWDLRVCRLHIYWQLLIQTIT